jgi:patatin-like phospholipase/acyl hydrolase
MPAYTRVLSLDGGGIRGLISTLMLAYIEEQTGKRTADLFDLIAGTSTGGVIALGLVFPGTPTQPPYSAKQLADFYIKEGPQIFSGRFGALRQVVEEKYPHKPMEDTLQRYFGNIRLEEALKPVIIPTYDVANAAPHFFKSRRTESDGQVLMWQVARATTAAPTFFEPIQIHMPGVSRALIDGGMIANNPAMCALAEVTNHIENYTTTDALSHPVIMVSLGTGRLPNDFTYEQIKDWSVLEWARPSIEITITGAVEAVHYQLQEIMRVADDRIYYRFQTDIPNSIRAMDDASDETLLQLREIAQQMIESRRDELYELIDKLMM